MQTNGERTVTIADHGQQFEVVNEAGRQICTIIYYPKSQLFARNVARLIQELQTLSKFSKSKLDGLPETIDTEDAEDVEEVMEQLERTAKPLIDYADAIDAFIVASDKIIGKGATESILENDDESLTNYMKIMNPIFKEYGEQRGKKVDKYRAKK